MSLESLSQNQDSLNVHGRNGQDRSDHQRQNHDDDNDIISSEEIHISQPGYCDDNDGADNTRHISHYINTNNEPNCDKASTPLGVSFFGAFFKFESISAKRTFHKALVLCITFLAYTCFHMGRRPLSIVKNVLNRNCSDIHHVTLFDQTEDITYLEYEPLTFSPITGSLTGMSAAAATTNSPKDPNWCDWAPFNDDASANQLLALLDSAFLFSYAIFMFFSGFLADRCNLRYFLSGGMILSGILLYAFGLSFYFNIHSMSYFVLIQILSGAIQTTGWPSVVSCVGHWFDQSSRGSIFGLWNANTNLGNILGATIAGYFVERSWGLSFMVPGFIMCGTGILVFLFLVPRPEDVNLHPFKAANHPSLKSRERDIEDAIDTLARDAGDPQNGYNNNNNDQNQRSRTSYRKKMARSSSRDIDSAVSETDDSQNYNHNHHNTRNVNNHDGESSPLIGSSHSGSTTSLAGHERSSQQHAVSFWTCLAIPGVVEYSLCLGFAKLVSYTFLYWLPRYITQSTLNNSEESAYLSVPFDIGGMFGAILAGYLSDRYKKSGVTCTVMLILAIPAMVIYEKFASISNTYNICLQLMTGALVNGPYALITTAVSTDLGSRIRDGKAMATVAAIIDGTGSIGAAIGPLFAGYISDLGWQSVFMMLMVSDMLAALCLIRITLKELNLR